MKIKVLLFTLILMILGILLRCKVGTVEPEETKIDHYKGIIVYISNRDNNEEIYTMNGDGSEQTNLTNNPAKDFIPVFQP